MIVVTGATGTVGAEVVRGLRERGAAVRAVVRPGSKGRPEWGDAVERAEADFADAASLDAALAGAEAVYLLVAVHPDMAAHERNVIDAAARSGHRPRVVLHAAAGVDRRPEGVRFIGAHTAGLDHLRASGLPWTVLAPNGFHQNFLGMAQAVRSGTLAVPGGAGAVSYVDARDVAEAAVEVLVGEGHEGAVYTLTGPESLTHGELAERLAAVAGRPVAYTAVEPAQALAGMLAAGRQPWRAEGLTELYGYYAAGNAAEVGPDTARLTGHPPRSFAEFAAEHAEDFRA
ncbi:NAD(P)H-binding protein [Kitasatospora sp. NPDC101183]|uniref:NAD(P)H-binding protein n=1 Tax=Kitasatospora sp. NPDC101183 TaxID=3364100 RepID=UPI00382BD54B